MRQKLVILCIIAMSFILIVSCGDDDDDNVPKLSADVPLEFNNLTIKKGTGWPVSALSTTSACDSTTIQSEVSLTDIPDDLWNNVEMIEFNQLDVDYWVQFEGAGDTLTCTLTIEYNGEDVNVATITVDQTHESLEAVTVETTAMEAINYYLDNWEETLNWCVSCTDNDVEDNYTLTYIPTFNVTVSE